MYPPLVRIFLNEVLFPPLNILFQVRFLNHITKFGQPNSPRKFERTNGMLKADRYPTFGFPSASPDIIMSMKSVDASSSKWRDCDAFGNVKLSNQQGPMLTISWHNNANCGSMC